MDPLGSETPESRPLRVLLIGNEWVTTRAGGLNRYLADLVTALNRRDVQPSALVVGHVDHPSVLGVSDPSEPLPARLLAVRWS